MLSHIRQAIDLWNQGKNVKDYERVDKDLLSLYLMARSRYVPGQGASIEIGCLHFLSLAWHSISDASPKRYATLHSFSKLHQFWLAFVAIGVELTNFAKEKKIAIPEEDIRFRIREMLLDRHDDIQIHRDITNGLAHIVTYIETYDAWLEFAQVWGQIVSSLPAYWLEVLQNNQKIADSNVTSGAASVVDLWSAIARLYGRARRGLNGKEARRLDPLCDAIVEMGVQVFQVLRVYYATRTEADSGWAHNVAQLLWELTHPYGRLLDEEVIKKFTDEATSILNLKEPPINEAVRKHFQAILQALPSPSPRSREEKMPDNDGGFPLR